MKLDIGASECPFCAEGNYPREDVLLLDISPVCHYNTCCKNNHMDIVADAAHLPFRDNVFDSINSGSCILVYPGIDAVIEAVRVLKPKCYLDITCYLISELAEWYEAKLDNRTPEPDVLLYNLRTERSNNYSRPGEPGDVGIYYVRLYKRHRVS